MDEICPNVNMSDKRLIAEKTVSQIKDHALCDNKNCFNVIYLCSSGEYCYLCHGTFCEDCCEYCVSCDDSHCKCEHFNHA